MKRILGIYTKNKKLEIDSYRNVINSISHLKTNTNDFVLTNNLLLSTYAEEEAEQSFIVKNDNIYVYTGLIYFEEKSSTNLSIEQQKQNKIIENFDNPESIQGVYNLIKYNQKTNELVLLNNQLRGYPLYYTQTNDIFIFCNDYEPLVKFRNNKYDININAIYDYALNKTTSITDTFFNQIKLLGPGESLFLNQLKFKLIPNQRQILTCKNKQTRDENTSILFDALQSETNSILNWNPNLPVTITGGADTRIIFGTMADDLRQKTNFITFISNRDIEKQSSDIKIAEQIAKHFSLRHKIKQHPLYRIEIVDNNYFQKLFNNNEVMLSGIYGSETLRFNNFYNQMPDIIRHFFANKYSISNISQYNKRKKEITKYLQKKSTKSFIRFTKDIYKNIKVFSKTDYEFAYTIISLSHSFFSSHWNGSAGNHLLPMSTDRNMISPFMTENVLRILLSIPIEQLTPDEKGICNNIFEKHLKHLSTFQSNSDICEYQNTILEKTLHKTIPQHINYKNIHDAIKNQYINDLKIFNLQKFKADFINKEQNKNYIWFDLLLWFDYISTL